MSERSRMRRRAARQGSWIGSAAVLVAIGIPLAGLAPIVSGSQWWFTSMTVVAVVLAAAGILRGLGMPAWTAILGALAAWLAVTELFFAPGTALLGVIPTRATFDTLLAGIGDAGVQIQVQRIPADPVSSLVQLIAMAVGLLAVVADAVVFTRLPALFGLVSLAVFATPYAVQQRPIDVVLFATTTASFLLVVWLSARVGRGLVQQPDPESRAGRAPATAVLLAAGAVTAALVIPNVTPGLTADSFDRGRAGATLPSVYGVGIDPVIQLGRDLRRTTPVLSLTYVTSSPTPIYLKMVDLTDFATGTWQPDIRENDRGDGDAPEFAAPQGLADDVDRVPVETTISIANLRSDWLPLPYPSTAISNLVAQWHVDPDSLTVTAADPNTDTRGESYRVESLSLSPTAEQLATAGSTLPDGIGRLLDLPVNLPSVVADTAAEVTASAGSNYDKAVALQSYFTSGAFSYSVQAPVTGGFDGSNGAAMAAFLEKKSGYCVHFASTMATMARTLGIPSRIAVGYFPGEPSSRDADGSPVYEVMSSQLHAWPELYFGGVGWLPFEPTPSLGITVPDYSLPDYAQVGAGDASGRTGDAGSADDRQNRDPGAGTSGAGSEAARALAQARAWLLAGGILTALVIVALLPFVMRRIGHGRALRRIANWRRPGTVAWKELIAVARDFGVEVSPGDTPRMFAARLAEVHGMPARELGLLLRAVEREQFASDDEMELDGTGEDRPAVAASLRAVARAIAWEATPGRARRARFLPASLLTRDRSSDTGSGIRSSEIELSDRR